MPDTLFDREAMAAWYARRHLRTDDGIVEVHYLPQNAPPREIRLIEVNNLVSETTPIEPVDFAVDIDGADSHRLYVLDVTPNQWEEILQGRIQPPAGWRIEPRTTFGR